MPTDSADKLRARFASNDLRTVWKALKAGALAKASTPDDAKAIEKLYKKFDGGLGPMLDKWTSEITKFPEHDAKKLGKLGADIRKVLIAYNKEVDDSDVVGPPALALKGGLKGIAQGCSDQFKEARDHHARVQAITADFSRARAAFAKNDLHKLWKKMKSTIAKDVKDKDAKKDVEKLYGKFDKGLGPLLDKWTGELKKMPKHDPAKLGQTGADLIKTISSYQAEVRKSDIPANARIGLSGVLDALARGATDQLKIHQEEAKAAR